MYLLKRITVMEAYLVAVFTFHYVSIKTNVIFISFLLEPQFTFHYVSIKTCSAAGNK